MCSLPAPRRSADPFPALASLTLAPNHRAQTFCPQVPQAYLSCSCPVSVRLTGAEMRLACPRGVAKVSDFYWQLASQSAFTCWTGRREVPLTDYLSSPNNVADPSDTQGPIFGDSGPRRRPALTPGGVAGLAIAVLLVCVALGAAGYFWGYRRVWQERHAKSFRRYEEGLEPGAGGNGSGGAGGVLSAQLAERSGR